MLRPAFSVMRAGQQLVDQFGPGDLGVIFPGMEELLRFLRRRWQSRQIKVGATQECLRVRQHTDLPMILDESMTGLDMVLRGAADNAMDLINLKINKVGGLVRARQVRDLCVELGIVMTVEDTWGSEVASAAIAHLAQSLPAGFHFQSSPFHAYNVGEVASGGPIVEAGRMRPTPGAGLGVDLHIDALGAPVLDVS